MRDLEKELQALLATDPATFARQRLDVWATRFDDGRDSLLFGAGQNGRTLARAMRAAGRPPRAFVTDVVAQQGTRVEDIPVMSPADARREFGPASVLVVTVFTPGHSHASTRARFEAAGFRVAPLFLAIGAHPNLLPFYFFGTPDQHLAERDELSRMFEKLVDDRSRAELVAHLRFRLTGDPEGLLEPIGQDLSFFSDIDPDAGVYVDGGAFDGDTVRPFLARWGDRFRRIEAFEPDPSSFARLASFRDSLPDGLRERVNVHRKGLWSTCTSVSFASTGTLGSAITTAGRADVEVVSVDSFLDPGERALVKLDVEGAEHDALEGARRNIAGGKTSLAVAVYHRPQDLVLLARQIRDINPRYRFALRSHNADGADLMLYALPPGN